MSLARLLRAMQCLVTLALLLAACAGSPATTADQEPSMTAASTDSAAATPDPSRFSSETTGPPAVEIRTTEMTAAVRVTDLAFDNGSGGQADAYLTVRRMNPFSDPRSQAAKRASVTVGAGLKNEPSVNP